MTSVSGGLNIAGEGGGKRLKLSGSIGASQALYIGQTQNNSFAPNVNLSAKLEAIENFAFVDAQASITPTFLSPFGAQPADLVNATKNRYTQQTYSVSPYIQGVLGSSGISYQLRDDNSWTVASGFGNSSANVPNTYSNSLSASMSSPGNPWGGRFEFSRYYYQGDNVDAPGATDIGGNSYTTLQAFARDVPDQIDPQLQVSRRARVRGLTSFR